MRDLRVSRVHRPGTLEKLYELIYLKLLYYNTSNKKWDFWICVKSIIALGIYMKY